MNGFDIDQTEKRLCEWNTELGIEIARWEELVTMRVINRSGHDPALEVIQLKKIAKLNRKIFLEKYRVKFESQIDEKKRAQIIIALLKAEPTHLAEPWIYAEVIKWMGHSKYIDYLQEAFISQKDRMRPTAAQWERIYSDLRLILTIDGIRDAYQCSVSEACKILANRQADEETCDRTLPMWDLKNDEQEFEQILRNRYYSKNTYKKFIKGRNSIQREIPEPYYRGE